MYASASQSTQFALNGTPRRRQTSRASAAASSTSFQAETTSSAKPRTPASQSSAMTRLWNGSTRMKATSAQRGKRSVDNGDKGQAEVDDPDLAGARTRSGRTGATRRAPRRTALHPCGHGGTPLRRAGSCRPRWSGQQHLAHRPILQCGVDRGAQGRSHAERRRIARRPTHHQGCRRRCGLRRRDGTRSRRPVLARRTPQQTPRLDRATGFPSGGDATPGGLHGPDQRGDLVEVAGHRAAAQPLAEAAGVDGDATAGRQRCRGGPPRECSSDRSGTAGGAAPARRRRPRGDPRVDGRSLRSGCHPRLLTTGFP